MSSFLLDTNVLLDIATKDSVWLGWSEAQFLAASAQGAIITNPVIYAERSPAFATEADLDAWIEPGVFQRAPLPYDSCWLVGQAFVKYRRAGGAKTSPLPDFFIGAHAEIAGLTVVTRDPGPFRTYFPSVGLISP